MAEPALIPGTRVPVSAVKEFAEAGYSIEEIMHEYPTLTRAEVEAALASPEPHAETRTYYYPMYAGGWTGSERYDSLADAQAEEAHHLGSLVVAFLRVTCINDRPVAVALEDADG